MASVRTILLVIVCSALLIAGLVMVTGQRGNESLRTSSDANWNGPLTPKEQQVSSSKPSNTMNPTAVITTNHGVIKLELFEDQMPITVGNFVSLAESGFYDHTKFHRVIDGFMIQGGDPNTKGENEALYGRGGPDTTVPDEFVKGDLLTNTRGTIAMANTGQPNSGGSQFFINLVDNTGLDFDKEPLTSKHPVFGRVIDGMDVVDEIGGVPTKPGDIPVDPVVVESVTIERN
jgi:peptidylprolyl isomerase